MSFTHLFLNWKEERRRGGRRVIWGELTGDVLPFASSFLLHCFFSTCKTSLTSGVLSDILLRFLCCSSPGPAFVKLLLQTGSASAETCCGLSPPFSSGSLFLAVHECEPPAILNCPQIHRGILETESRGQLPTIGTAIGLSLLSARVDVREYRRYTVSKLTKIVLCFAPLPPCNATCNFSCFWKTEVGCLMMSVK